VTQLRRFWFSVGPTGTLLTVFTLLAPHSIAQGPPPPVLSAIHTFTGSPADGANPQAGLVRSEGIFYGTTVSGGTATACFFGCGTVFSLTVPSTAGGAWTEQIICSFTSGSDGSNPSSGLVVGKDGVLYGETAEVKTLVSNHLKT
jgi:hypothetical protein